METTVTVKKSLLSIDYSSKPTTTRLPVCSPAHIYTENIALTDYLQEGDVGFKKPKTKKKRSSRRQADVSDVVDGVGADQMQVDEKPIVPRQRNLDANFVDDDELQAALARSRRAKMQKPKRLSPEELARKSKCILV